MPTDERADLRAALAPYQDKDGGIHVDDAADVPQFIERLRAALAASPELGRECGCTGRWDEAETCGYCGHPNGVDGQWTATVRDKHNEDGVCHARLASPEPGQPEPAREAALHRLVVRAHRHLVMRGVPTEGEQTYLKLMDDLLDEVQALATPSPQPLDEERLARAILHCIEALPSRRAWEDLSIREQAEQIAARLASTEPSAESPAASPSEPKPND